MNNIKGKNILIRADSSTQIGTGHIMRSHVLAQTLKDQGANITYACRDCRGHLIPFIKSQGYDVRVISSPDNIEFSPNDYTTWLGSSVENDIHQTFAECDYDLVIIDHYGANIEWQKTARKFAKFIMVIDDEAIQKFDCDILLNQNYYPQSSDLYKSKLPNRCNSLIGPQYALLRSEFSARHDLVHTRTKFSSLLVIMGGADPDNLTQKIAETLKVNNHINTTIVVGGAYQHEDSLSDICNEKGYALIKCANNMAELMGDADFCIGAAGSTSWERCCMKLPAALFSLADNQVPIAKNLEKFGANIYMGDAKDYDFVKLNDILTNLINHPDQLEIMSKKAGELTDGKGIQRVFEEISDLF